MLKPRTWLIALVSCATLGLAACSDDESSPASESDCKVDRCPPRDGGAKDAATPVDAANSGDVDAQTQLDAATTEVDAGPATLTEAEFITEIAAAFCETIPPCCDHGTKGCTTELAKEVKDVIAKGKADKNVFSETYAAKCVAAVKALPKVECLTWFASLNDSLRLCSPVLDGTVAPGDECTGPTECERGLFNGTLNGGSVGCAEFDNMGPARCRAFESTTVVGTPCEMGFAGTSSHVFKCAEGLECIEGTCQTAPACSAEEMYGTCKDGKVCAAGVCRVASKEGDDCSSVPCATGLNCEPDSNKCAPFPKTPWILSIGFWSTTYECPK